VCRHTPLAGARQFITYYYIGFPVGLQYFQTCGVEKTDIADNLTKILNL